MIRELSAPDSPEALAARRAALVSALAPVSRRVRVQRALRALALFVPLAAAAAVLASILYAVGALQSVDRDRVYFFAVLLAGWGLALGWSRAPSWPEVGVLVDRTHALGGRIVTALGLLDDLARGDRPSSPMAMAAVSDAVERSRSIDAARAFPLTAPSRTRAALLAAAVAMLALLLGPPLPAAVATIEPAHRLRGVAVHEDDLRAARDHLAALPERHRSPEVRAEIDALNALLEGLAAREVERTEALRRLGEIAEGLTNARPGALEATIEALEPMARTLARSEPTAALGEALRERDLSRAATEMERLAESMEREPPSPAELARLRETLAAAARELDTESLRREREALEEQEDRLLHREREEAAMSETERAERAEERERELERLRRDIEERREREAELEALRRELSEAMGERESEGGSGERESESGMERAAESMRRFADEAAGEDERGALEREVEAMRELIRRMREGDSDESGSSGEGSSSESPGGAEGGEGTSRMDRFVLRARGEGEEGEGEGMPLGVPGERGGERGEGGTEGSAGEGGEGESAGSRPGAGAEGGGEGEGGAGDSEMLVLGEGGDARLEIPGMGGAGSSGDERGAGSGTGEPESAGDGRGTGTDGASEAEASARSGDHTTVRVAGAEGAGPSRSEVIRTSAARGFASRAYRDVYGDYRSHAEEALEDEEIPPGYRFYVERYFQLIRPRE